VKGVEYIELDITNWVRLEDLILKKQPSIVVHAAAYTNVDGCETNKENAWKVNVKATQSIIRAARVVNAYLVYISTDYIFSGEKGLYKEDDVPSPVNYYGLTKLVAEELVKSSELLYTIVRPSAIYGLGGSKKSFAEYVAEQLTNSRSIRVLKDQYVSPTYNQLLAETIVEMIDLKPLGIFHVAGPRMSRLEFARKVATTLKLPTELIEPATMEEFSTKWVAKRPRDSSLDISKAEKIFKTPFSDLELAMKYFREEWRSYRQKQD